ncbi:MAG TPA: undecaprenyldiphospho-muramoylpentapeptide beta-N-acetylglucosaminyltransferase [Actinomycetota bacterium]
MSVSVVIAAGGTGGHVLPGLAVADEVRAMRPDARVSFVGVERGERAMVPTGYGFHSTAARPFDGGAQAARAAGALVVATAQARRILRDERASVVLGMGGYPSIPAVIAARTSRVPALVHEANAVPGLANKLCARFTPNVAAAFPGTSIAGRAARTVGMPLRASILELDREAARREANAAYNLDPGRTTILAFGGSLGAARLNEAVARLVHEWRDRTDVQVLWGTGRDHEAAARARLPDGALVVRCLGFLERMDLAYAAADLVVARAGASTVFELAAVGLPSILVPLPVARAREQDANAAALVRLGAARVISDERIVERLAREADELNGDPLAREAMSAAATRLARPGAARALASWTLELAGA